MIYHSMRIKIRRARIVTIVFLVAIAAKLTYSQVIRYQTLSKLASDLWERSFPIEASRGYILDRNGIPLAINLPTMTVAAIPFQITNANSTASSLAPILGVNAQIIYNKITKHESMVILKPEGSKITDEQVQAISALNLDGIYLIQDSERYYPYGESLAQTLGFVGIDNQGLSGLEYYYDQFLSGTDGSLNYMMDAKGGLFTQFQSELVAPEAGFTLQLTIDANIQNMMERELTNAYLKYNPDSIYAIAMDPNTGEILAMSSRPTYDPNNYQDYDASIYDQNLPIWKSFEPGSTFKVFTFAAALEEQVIDMDTSKYYDKGYETIGGVTIKSWKKGGHGLQTFLEVLENSSNPGFVELSRRLGKETLYDYIKAFGFSKKTGVDIVGESTGIFFNEDDYGVVENATSAFGQGVSVTAIQMVTAFSALINGGYLYQPYIGSSILQTSTQDIIAKQTPTVVSQVIRKETSNLMRRALESVVAKGTGRNAYLDGYRVGGKTGTAQKVSNGVYLDGEYILSFIGAAPMDDPQIVIYIAIDNPKSVVQYGGTIVAPIVRSILEDSLPLLGVEKRDSPIEREYTWMDTKTYDVPNFIGFNKSKVKSSIFKFEFIGEGTTVVDQLPRVGVRMEQGNTIVIMLN